MRTIVAGLVVCTCVAAAATASAQTAPAAGTDIYHVHFAKSAPGQAVAHAKDLMTPDSSLAMPNHFVVLRHQEGDDWDFVVIQHLGAKAEIVAATTPPPPGAPGSVAWHSDTFVSGPSWGEFSKQMGIGGSANASSQVYIVGVQRAVPGHRTELLASLSAAGAPSKIQPGTVLLQHVEGGDWTFLTISRYDSWQDFGTDRAAAAAASAGVAGGWADIRQHSAFHRDTIADRLYPMK
jgi:hypothetical protein